LERRLQTLVYRRGLANTVGQARQFIIHNHVMVDKKRVDVPSFIVPQGGEDKIVLTGKVKVEKSGRKQKSEEKEAA
jgi:small subunit ribosomal protein S4